MGPTAGSDVSDEINLVPCRGFGSRIADDEQCFGRHTASECRPFSCHLVVRRYNRYLINGRLKPKCATFQFDNSFVQ